MDRKITTSDAIALYRVLEKDHEELSHYFNCNAPVSARSFFSAGYLHDIQQVLRQAVNSMLTVNLVASGITACGKEQVAHQWLMSMGLAPSKSSGQSSQSSPDYVITVSDNVLQSYADSFMNVAGRVAVLQPLLYDDNEFNRFCDALGLPQTVAMELTYNRTNRAYLALTRWWNMARYTVSDLIKVLHVFSPSTLEALGLARLSSQPVVVPISLPVLPQQTSQAQGGKSLIGQALKRLNTNQEISRRDFFGATDGIHYTSCQELIAVLDKTGLWEMILANTGLLENPEVAAEVVLRQQRWEVEEISPTKQMISDFLEDSTWANKSMKEFAEELFEISNPELKAVVQKWIEKVDGKLRLAQKAGLKRFETAKDLNAFFMELVNDDQVFKPEMVRMIVSKLQQDDITNIKLLRKLKDEDLKQYGMTRGQIMTVRDALDELEKTKDSCSSSQ